jgi:hypothetical protein
MAFEKSDDSGDLRGDPWLFLPGAKLNAGRFSEDARHNNPLNGPCQQKLPHRRQPAQAYSVCVAS